MTYSRRDALRFTAALGATPLLGNHRSVYGGVMLGAQSYSFRDRSFDAMIDAMNKIGLTYVELWSGHVEPKAQGDDKAKQREALRDWRLNAPLSELRDVRKKLDQAGIILYAYNYSMRNDFTPEELKRGFDMAQALGVTRLTSSSNVSTAAKIDPYAAAAHVSVGMHNHSRIHDDEFATPENFAQAMKGMSEFIAINLDIGHFTAANFDPVDYLDKHHADIVTLHIKDRKRNQGDNVSFGQGDTPIKECLQLLKNKQYLIPAMIEYEYKGGDTVEEVRKSAEYCKNALK